MKLLTNRAFDNMRCNIMPKICVNLQRTPSNKFVLRKEKKIMKRVKTLLLTVVAFFAVNTALHAADDDAFISVKQSGEKQALIRVANLTDASVAILKIKSSSGQTLYREVITDQTHMKRYNFSNLPTGTYEVEVKTENGVSKEVFQITEGEKSSVYFKPAIQVEPDMVKVAFMNKINSPVSLKLYAENGEVLYEESVASQEVYAKGLNVSKLQPGKYSVSLVGDNYVYSRSIDVK